MRPVGFLHALALASLLPGASATAGVVVDEVAAGGEADKVGLREGDRLVSWSREPRGADPQPARGAIEWPQDLVALEIEQAPRGAVRLDGWRDGQPLSVTLGGGQWSIAVLPATAGEESRRAREQERAGAHLDAAERWTRASAAPGIPSAEAAWFLVRAGDALSRADRWNESDQVYERALRAMEPHPRGRAVLLRLSCARLLRRPLDILGQCWDRAVRETREAAPDSLLLAAAITSAARVSSFRGDLARAEAGHQEALRLRRALAPGSDAHAGSVSNLGIVARARGDLETAQARFGEAFEISQAAVPDGLNAATFLSNLGEVLRARGDLDGAYAHQLRALAIRSRLGTADVAASLHNLASVAQDRGDLAAAEQHLMEVVPLWEQHMPGSHWLAAACNALGEVLAARGELDAAEVQFRRALGLIERTAPQGGEVADALDNLALVAFRRGDLAGAEASWTTALEAKTHTAPGSLTVAVTLARLARAAEARGDLGGAERREREALAIRRAKAPASLAEAESRYRLAALAQRRGETAASEEELRMAIGIQERLGPSSAALAESLHALGRARSSAGDAPGATLHLCRAVDVLEAQRERLGGADQARTAFGTLYLDHHYACMEALLGQGRAAEAYAVLERSRARSFLRMLGERHLTFAGRLDPELVRRRKAQEIEYDKTQAALAELSPVQDGPQVEALLARLQELGREEQEVGRAIRASSPDLGALQYPQPVDLQGARAALDPGTVLLAYAVGEDRTLLFAVRAQADPGPGVTVWSLPIGKGQLRGKVDAFRKAILSRAATATLAARGGALYDLLVRPADPALAGGRRLLISADGPLHSLPFAALARPTPGRRSRQYLVEWRPIHMVASATVYQRLKEARRDTPRAPTLAAFGDPQYPPPDSSRASGLVDAELRAAVTRGSNFRPLPGSRDEVQRIAGLFPGQARTFLGQAATEEQAKGLDRDTTYIHFACHAVLDERSPLNSALVLSIPSPQAPRGENGLLHTWEIFEHVRLDADLVTLSACQTALGKEADGEGLLGLTRAFLYAGARSVLGSLWPVSDKSTPRLMTGLYAYLKAGRTRDDALRAAQVDLIRRRSGQGASPARHSHPFHWAAFQLSGDWR
jgi:CHAT domain-containing protein